MLYEILSRQATGVKGLRVSAFLPLICWPGFETGQGGAGEGNPPWSQLVPLGPSKFLALPSAEPLKGGVQLPRREDVNGASGGLPCPVKERLGMCLPKGVGLPGYVNGYGLKTFPTDVLTILQKSDKTT